MDKKANYFAGIALLIGFFFSSGLYFGALHFLPATAWLFFSLTIILITLGLVKILNYLAHIWFPALLRRIICWFHSLSFEILAIGTSFLMLPFGFGAENTKSYGLKTGRPILMIHGYLQNASNWNFMKWALGKQGFGPIYTMNLFHPFRSVRDYAKFVSEKAEKIEKETGRSDLVLIGHSMGGLVTSWYAANIAPKGKIMDVITIGSPLGGTLLAAIAIGPNGREMRRGSDFVHDLQKQIAQKEDIRFYHIASKADQIILPYSSALMEQHPDREYIVDDIGHWTLLLSPRVINKVSEWLRGCC